MRKELKKKIEEILRSTEDIYLAKEWDKILDKLLALYSSLNTLVERERPEGAMVKALEVFKCPNCGVQSPRGNIHTTDCLEYKPSQKAEDKPSPQFGVGDIVLLLGDAMNLGDTVCMIVKINTIAQNYYLRGKTVGLWAGAERIALLFPSPPKELDGRKVGDIVEFCLGGKIGIGEITGVLPGTPYPLSVLCFDSVDDKWYSRSITPSDIKRKLWPAEEVLCENTESML